MSLLFQKAWEELKQTALEDNQLTEEEMKVIEKVMEGLERYYILLTKIQEQGMVDEGDKHFLFRTRQQIWENAMQAILDDEFVSDDEHKLILKVGQIMLELEGEEY